MDRCGFSETLRAVELTEIFEMGGKLGDNFFVLRRGKVETFKAFADKIAPVTHGRPQRGARVPGKKSAIRGAEG